MIAEHCTHQRRHDGQRAREDMSRCGAQAMLPSSGWVQMLKRHGDAAYASGIAQRRRNSY